MIPKETFYATGPLSNPAIMPIYMPACPLTKANLAKLTKVPQITSSGGRYGLHLTPERQEEVQLRTMPRRWPHARTGPAPLSKCSTERKLVGNCRYLALMLVSNLRQPVCSRDAGAFRGLLYAEPF